MHVSEEMGRCSCKVIKQHTALFKPQPSEVRDKKSGNRVQKVRWKPVIKGFTAELVQLDEQCLSHKRRQQGAEMIFGWMPVEYFVILM